MVSTAAFHARVRGSVPSLGGLKETKMFLPHPRVKLSIVGSLHDREVACSASDHQGSNFESCVWRTVSSHSSHHPQEVLLAQFSLYVHKGGIKPDSFHFIFILPNISHRSQDSSVIGTRASPTNTVYIYVKPMLLRTDRQTDRQNVLFATKIINMMINNETVKRQEIPIKIETIADMETTL